MAKSKNPLFSFGAAGSLAHRLTFRRHGSLSVAESLPTHKDAKTGPQLAHRVMFQACKDLWHTLSEGEQLTWEAAARDKHMTGFAYWQSQCLRPNPGVYLPLAGGTMSGVIAMATHGITGLPNPADSQDADTKAAREAADTTEANTRATADGLLLPKAGGTMSGNIAMASHRITALPIPGADDDAARYQDAKARAGASVGSYVGSGAVNRAIPHNLGKLPRFIFILRDTGVMWYSQNPYVARIYYLSAALNSYLAVTVMTDAYFYVGNATSYDNSANASPNTYYWAAIG